MKFTIGAGNSPFENVQLNIVVFIVGLFISLIGISMLYDYFTVNDMYNVKHVSVEGVVDTAYYEYTVDSENKKEVKSYKFKIQTSSHEYVVDQTFSYMYRELGNSIKPLSPIKVTYLSGEYSHPYTVVALTGKNVFFTLDDYVSIKKGKGSNGFMLFPVGMIFMYYAFLLLRKHYRKMRSHF